MKIQDQSVVSIHYTLTIDGGETIDSSRDGDPLTYIHRGGLIPGLEAELEGRESGDSFQASIQPADGYGEVNPQLVRQVPMEALAGIEDVRVGMQLQSQDPQGRIEYLFVEAIEGDNVTLNANHPLAGQVLHFDVTVMEVREATEEELAQRP